MSLAIRPALIASPADASALPVNRIRAVAARVSDGAVLGSSTVDVDPAASEWTLSLYVRLPAAAVDVTLTVSLLNVASDGSESVQFSGVATPLTLTEGATIEPDVAIVRGPAANAYVTGVAIASAPDTLLEARDATIDATATTSASVPPTVFWTVLDTAVLSVSGNRLTGRVPGTGRVVASAGRFADTATVVVRAAPAVIDVTPDTANLSGSGARTTYQAVAIDVRGDTLTGEPITWRSATPSVVTSLGGGLVEAVGAGTGVVEAFATADPAVVGRAYAVVGQAALPRVDVRVLKTVDRTQPLSGDRIRFTVSATNAGVVAATDLAVFDTLRRASFTSPSHAVSTGTLVGDSLWRIPTLASGATATWTTDVTVAAGVAGQSASNTALLRSLAQSDSTPANDTARVTLSFPLSAVPTVQITQPADSSVFDPGDPITFVATASDPEDGNLTSTIAWRSNLDGSLGSGGSVTTSSLRAGVHTISASATDSHGGTGADTIRVTVALYTMPSTLNVPFGGTASLPITLSQPAPAGGITLSVVSSASSIANPTSSSVFIPQGALSANATLAGVAPGTANITVGSSQFGSAVVVATVRAELDILGGSVTFAQPFSSSITVQLESQGTAIAAPPGGLPVTLTAVDPGCVAVASSITIPAGQVSRATPLTWGGSTATACSTYVRATAPSITPDSVSVSVTPTPGITVTARTVGAGLQDNASFSLGAGGHGGVTVTLASSDPTKVLVAPDATTPGTASINVNVPDGTTSVGFYVQGVEGTTGTASVNVTAPSFNAGSATMTVVQPGVMLAQLTASATTLSPDDHFYAYVGTPSGSGVNPQNVRAGGTAITVTFAVDNTSIGVLKSGVIQDDTVTATIVQGLYYTPSTVAAGGVALDPVGVGTVTVTARSTGLLTQPSATQAVTISAPGITVSARTVGAGLQDNTSFSLGAGGHGGVTVTLASSDPTKVLVAPNATTAGAASISINVADGSTSGSFYVQGVEGTTGTASVNVTAPSFNPGSATMTVVQTGVMLAGLNASTTTLSPDDHFYAYVGVPSGSGVSTQDVRAGGSPITVTFAVSNASIGILEQGVIQDDTVTATIVQGLYYTPSTVAAGGVALDPVGVGTVTVTARSTGLVTQPAATQDVTVSAPGITVTARTVGAGLQDNASFSLGAGGHGGVSVTLTSSDPSTVLLAPNATTAGAASISINVADGSTSGSFYVQGVEGTTGTATITVTAAGFLDGTATVTVVQTGLMISGLPTSLAVGAANDHFYAYVGVPSGSGVSTQDVRAGSPGITVTATSGNVSVARIVTSGGAGASRTAVIVPGLYYTPVSLAAGGFELDPLAVGQASVSVSAPGVVTQPSGTQLVTITP